MVRTVACNRTLLYTEPIHSTPLRSTLFFLPYLVVATGAAALGALSAPHARAAFATNGAAAIVATALFFLGFARWERVQQTMAWVFAVLLGLTFIGTGLSGVHRWLVLGPVRVNVSAALLPVILAPLTSKDPLTRTRALLLLPIVQCLHLAQPDAAQATVLAVAAIPLVNARTLIPRGVGTAITTSLVVMAALTWLRPDPLVAVPHVEQILSLIAARSALHLVLAMVLMVLALSAPWVTGRVPGMRPMGWSFSLYFAAQLAVTFAGNFPVPLFGAGAGPVFGYLVFAMLLYGVHLKEAPPP